MLGGVLVVCGECYNLGYIVKSVVLFPPPFYFVLKNSNLLTYIQTNTRNEIARPVLGTTFLVDMNGE